MEEREGVRPRLVNELRRRSLSGGLEDALRFSWDARAEGPRHGDAVAATGEVVVAPSRDVGRDPALVGLPDNVIELRENVATVGVTE